jgi:Rrf2 family protein
MNFSKTTEYALQILNFMAGDETKLYTANEIYEQLKIPYRYLRKQLTIMTKNNLLISVQGKEGGYKAGKKNDQFTLLDIIQGTGDSILKNDCFFGFGNCALTEKCIMHEKWSKIRENIQQVLSTTSLADIKKNQLINLNKSTT